LTIDPVHSSVEFSLDDMGVSTYRTGFRALEGYERLMSRLMASR
jgi:polyisoprenoid-binding protein YceI